mmetsp:Transcript_27151/g.59765  ORF Transcript_27151/g.59765 Transcript_27151/m.59765 type:complete len:231 (-) Transcript_27151:189-881(-)
MLLLSVLNAVTKLVPGAVPTWLLPIVGATVCSMPAGTWPTSSRGVTSVSAPVLSMIASVSFCGGSVSSTSSGTFSMISSGTFSMISSGTFSMISSETSSSTVIGSSVIGESKEPFSFVSSFTALKEASILACLLLTPYLMDKPNNTQKLAAHKRINNSFLRLFGSSSFFSPVESLGSDGIEGPNSLASIDSPSSVKDSLSVKLCFLSSLASVSGGGGGTDSPREELSSFN